MKKVLFLNSHLSGSVLRYFHIEIYVLFIHNDYMVVKCVSVSVDDRALGNVENIFIVSTQMFKLCFCVGTLFFGKFSNL